MQTRTLTMLDHTGDMTIGWDEDTDDKMLKIIEERMSRGYIFYIIKPSKVPLLPPRQVRAKNMAEVRRAGSVVIRDEDIATLFTSGEITTTKSADHFDTVRRAANANDAAKNHSVAIRPVRGG